MSAKQDTKQELSSLVNLDDLKRKCVLPFYWGYMRQEDGTYLIARHEGFGGDFIRDKAGRFIYHPMCIEN
jgi:hypothetical protein